MSSERGSSLLESMVALALFGIASAAVGDLLARQIRMQGSNSTRTTAIGLAERELEDLRALDYADIPTSRTSTKTVASLTYTVKSTATFNAPAVNMKTIQTEVDWTEPAGSQSYVLNAIYTAVKR